jgi:glycosyltransferase involved in cell wall biosynthesis
MSSLKSDAELRQRMGQAARSIAEQHSWTSMAQRYVDVFEGLERQSSHQITSPVEKIRVPAMT